jgi:type II secretory pathway component PulJ
VIDLRQRLLALWSPRSPREQALLGFGVLAALLVVLHTSAVRPLRAHLQRANARAELLERQVQQAERLAAEALRLRADLTRVEARVASSSKANLFTLIEGLASSSGLKDQLESIKPKQPSGNPAYPETRVEVALSGATLEQLTQLLHQIETAPLHLIIRSLRIKAQGGKDSTLLDVRFSVSSFERT